MFNFVEEEALIICLLRGFLAAIADGRDDERDRVVCPVRRGFSFYGRVFFGNERCTSSVPLDSVIR